MWFVCCFFYEEDTIKIKNGKVECCLENNKTLFFSFVLNCETVQWIFLNDNVWEDRENSLLFTWNLIPISKPLSHFKFNTIFFSSDGQDFSIISSQYAVCMFFLRAMHGLFGHILIQFFSIIITGHYALRVQVFGVHLHETRQQYWWVWSDRINLSSKEEFHKWWTDFHGSSLTTMRVKRTVEILPTWGTVLRLELLRPIQALRILPIQKWKTGLKSGCGLQGTEGGKKEEKECK